MPDSGDRQAEIVHAALDLLDERGLGGLTLRAIAARLGVQLNTVTWHVHSKARLLELVADAILADVSLVDLPGQWNSRIRELAHRYRAALLRRRDGAALVIGTNAAMPHTLDVAEAFVSCLLEAGFSEQDSAWTCWTIAYFALGLTEEQQRTSGTESGVITMAVSPTPYPALSRVLLHLADFRFDARFDFGLDLIINGLLHRAPTEPSESNGGD
jgi:TetR/AcrR family tetracycline transcriptional repressor